MPHPQQLVPGGGHGEVPQRKLMLGAVPNDIGLHAGGQVRNSLKGFVPSPTQM